MCEIIRFICDLSSTLLTISQKSRNSSLAASGLSQSGGLAAHRFGDVSVLRNAVEVLGPNPGQDVHDGGYGCARIAGEIVNDRIIPSPTTVHRD